MGDYVHAIQSDSDTDGDEAPLAVSLSGHGEPRASHIKETHALEYQQSHKDTPVPATIITGCLGAGKTTLVHHILKADHGMKIAVVMNEFGEEQGLEKEMLSQQQADLFSLGEWVELANGCLCCSVKDDFLRALEALMEQRKNFDYIIIETTGLADPGPVAASLWTDAELHSSICLDAIVTVVDAYNVPKQLLEHKATEAINEAERQIAYADVILLNKVDLVRTPMDLANVETMLKAINPEAIILRTQHSCVDIKAVLDRGMYRDTGWSERWSQEGTIREGDTADAHEHSIGVSADTAESRRACELEEEGIRGSSSDVQPNSSSPAGCDDSSLCSREATQADRAEHREAGHPTHARHSHTAQEGITTLTLRTDRKLDLERFERFVEDLLWGGEDAEDARSEIFRMKGIVHVTDSDKLHLVQAVRELYDITEAPFGAKVDAEVGQSRVVVIGRIMDPARLHAEFEQCCER